MSIDFAITVDTKKFALAQQSKLEDGRKHFPKLGVNLTPRIASHGWTESEDGRLTLVIARVNGEFEEHHFEKQGIKPESKKPDILEWWMENESRLLELINIRKTRELSLLEREKARQLSEEIKGRNPDFMAYIISDRLANGESLEIKEKKSVPL